jgi:hypothetical protein
LLAVRVESAPYEYLPSYFYIKCERTTIFPEDVHKNNGQNVKELPPYLIMY